MTAPGLRVVSYNVHGSRGARDALARLVRPLRPDVLVVHEGPRGLRWRTPCAEIARSVGMFYAAGGKPAMGNMIAVSPRVRVVKTWCVRFTLAPGRPLRGVVLARLGVGPSTVVVAGTHLSTDAADPLARPGPAGLLASVLSEVDDPLVVAGDLNQPLGTAWSELASTWVDAAGDDARGTFPAVAPTQRAAAVLVDPRLAITAYDVVAGGMPSPRAHLPVLVDLSLPD